MIQRLAVLGVAGVLLWCQAGCAPAPGTPLARRGDEIIVCGRLFHTGAPVVTWLDPGGYDAYRTDLKFPPAASSGRPSDSRPASGPAPRITYGQWRFPLPDDLADQIKARSWKLEELQQVVDQFVIHYDACGTSRECFRVLHDLRELSVQFMLDLDGTIYQTLDLKERAWHANEANSRCVGVEIAHIGAYPDMKVLDRWYQPDARSLLRIVLPESFGDGGIRTPGFVGRPARPGVFRGRIQGRELLQYDYTREQYESLIKLTAALCRVFPKLRCDVPRHADGTLIDRVLSREESAAYRGLLGHWHVYPLKVDPGPAFDWERVINGARRYLGQTPEPVRLAGS